MSKNEFKGIIFFFCLLLLIQPLNLINPLFAQTIFKSNSNSILIAKKHSKYRSKKKRRQKARQNNRKIRRLKKKNKKINSSFGNLSGINFGHEVRYLTEQKSDKIETNRAYLTLMNKATYETDNSSTTYALDANGTIFYDEAFDWNLSSLYLDKLNSRSLVMLISLESKTIFFGMRNSLNCFGS